MSGRAPSEDEGRFAGLWPTWRADWVLYEDEDLFVVDKPAGLATHPPEPDRIDDAHTRALEWLAARGDRAPYLGIHQRLDRETSGVLLFTRRREANANVAAELEGRRAKKTYVALVVGKPPEQGELRHRLAKGEGGSVRVLSPNARGGQEAITRFRVLARHRGMARVELSPITGRMHQIRVQLAAAGFPIVGDVRYGGPPAERLFLHAASLTLAHPKTRRPVTFQARVPAVFDAHVAGEHGGLFESIASVERAMRAAALDRYALAKREDTDAFRIVNDSGDGLAGVTMDRYGDWLVVSLLGDEALREREKILDAASSLGAAGVYVKIRPKDASRAVDTRREETAPREAVRGVSAPEEFTIHELGLPFEVRLGDGLSTGIFLDQRENRRRVRELARGARVLNLFAYTGAFSVAAAAGAAASTVTVDVSRTVLAWARKNLDAIGADSERHTIVEADVLGWLRANRSLSARFDLILLDPPSYSTTKSSRWSAASDYPDLAAQCLSLLAPGGRLVACTNHRGIVRVKLRRFLHEAARTAGREVTQMKDWPDPSDFPAPPGSEAHLKTVVVTVK
jgi:23S rRNA (cytosine1962-C5)-methyltransferase